MTSPERSRLLSGTAVVVPADGLDAKLALGRPLRVKLGLDPTATDVTLGWAVVLRKLRQFQDAGHAAVLIVGDFTARVGDPSGKSETRPRLDKAVVREYAERLLGQFAKILSRERLEVRYNSEWLEPMDMETVLRLTATTTVARMLERDDFAKRYARGRPISIMEFLYPLLQGMDSVAVQADVELGGSDQLFNLLAGRDVQRAFGQEPQVALTMPLLIGIDGEQKMSQSLGNYVGIEEPADDMFGKLMRIPDELVVEYLRLCTDDDPGEVDRIRAEMEGGLRPDIAKRRMAREVVDLYHGAGEGSSAEHRFDRVHRDRELPETLQEAAIPPSAVRNGTVWLPRLIAELRLLSSNAEGRRMVEQGGVRLDGTPVTDPGAEFPVGDLRGKVLGLGSRTFVRLT